MLTRSCVSRLGFGIVGASVMLATGCAPSLTAQWKVTSDVSEVGFATLDLKSDGTYIETGRTDGQSESGTYSEPNAITIDPDFGTAPKGMTGPYLQLVTDDTGDGQWDYGYTLGEGSLTLVRYAQRSGMGLRWAAPITITLSNQ